MIIKNARILSFGIEEGIYDILIGEKILEISKGIEIPVEEKVIDVNGMYVTPGLIDAHTHLGLKSDSLGEFYSEHNEKNSKISPHLRAIDAINPQDITFREALNAGITSCASGPGSANIIGGQFACIKTYGNVIDKMIVDPYIAMKASLGENPKKNYETTRMGIASDLREFLLECKSYMDNFVGKEYDKKYFPMLPIMRGEKPLKIHAHSANDIVTAIRIAEEIGIKFTLEHVTCGVEILNFLKSKKEIPLLLGPSLGARSKKELSGKSFENVVKLSEGRDVCLITDAPVIPLQYLPICAGIAISKGMDYLKAFESITINPAKVMGLENRIGSLAEGKDADIIVWKEKPLITIQDPIYVIVNGKVVKGD